MPVQKSVKTQNAKAQNSRLIEFPTQADAGSKPDQAVPKRDFRYLWIYAVSIFSVAIVLMLLSFLSQSRRVEQQHMDLSFSAIKSIDAMKDENDTLKRENADLNLEKNALLGQITDLQHQLDALLQSNEALRGELSGTEAILEQSIGQYEEMMRQFDQ